MDMKRFVAVLLAQLTLGRFSPSLRLHNSPRWLPKPLRSITTLLPR
jgi:hypothetical protein